MTNIEEFAKGEALFDGHYRLLRPLNKAANFSDVWLAVDVNTIDNYFSQYGDSNHVIDESSGLQVVIKIYHPYKTFDIESEQSFRDKYRIMHDCHHVNLLQPIGFSVFENIPYLVFPYCEAGSAEKYIGKMMSKVMLWNFISDVASGLDRLHTNKPQIVHQNIKPANILIDNNGNFTITDFGIGYQPLVGDKGCYDDKTSRRLAYMAPECFAQNAKPMPESDIWAFGATLCEILTGIVPFGEKGGKTQSEGKVSMPELKEVPSSVKNLIRACLQSDPEKRPSARQIKEAAQKKRFTTKQKKFVLPIIIAVTSILVIGGIIGFFVTHEKPETIVEEKYTYDKVMGLLLDETTATEGLRMLDTLVSKNDYQATFLMSRLYFDNSDYRDTMFFEPIWAVMRFNCGIQPDNKKAHNLLMQAFRLNESDYVLLYQLGNDFMARGRRGCDRDDSRALWCFNQIEKLVENTKEPMADRYREAATEKKQRILENPTNFITPQKP